MKYCFIFIILLVLSCNKLFPPNHTLAIYNNSNKKISVYYGELSKPVFPDTTLPLTRPDNIHIIQPGSQIVYRKGKDWKDIFSKTSKDTLSVFIFSTDTLEKYNWEAIRNNYKILKRIDFDLKHLDKFKGIYYK